MGPFVLGRQMERTKRRTFGSTFFSDSPHPSQFRMCLVDLSRICFAPCFLLNHWPHHLPPTKTQCLEFGPDGSALAKVEDQRQSRRHSCLLSAAIYSFGRAPVRLFSSSCPFSDSIGPGSDLASNVFTPKTADPLTTLFASVCPTQTTWMTYSYWLRVIELEFAFFALFSNSFFHVVL